MPDFRSYQRAKPASARVLPCAVVGVRGSTRRIIVLDFAPLHILDAGGFRQGKVNHGT